MEQLMNTTIGRQLEKFAGLYPNDEMIKYTDRDYRRTWKEFDDEVNRYARGLLAMGIGKGDHVAIWATNVPEWLLTLFASAKIGAVLVTVNTNYKIFEMEYLLGQSDCKAIVLIEGFKDAGYADIMTELVPELAARGDGELQSKKFPFLKHVFYVGDNPRPGMVSFESIQDHADEYDEAEFRALTDSLQTHDTINMQYTSGTTGFPKGVMLTHYNIVNNGAIIGDCMKFTHDDKLCIPVPFFHCFGLVLAVMACLTHGAAMVPIPVYRPLDVMQAVQDEQCTALHGVPTMFIGILDHPEFKNYKFPRLRTGIMAGSPCPIKVMQQVVDEMGASEITIVFGQTESSPGCTQTLADDPIELKVSTVGRSHPFVENRIVDPETGKDCPVGVPGEFCTRGYHIMKGYYKMPEATAAAIDKDGWLHTGDLATVDENGYYKITGRIKDMIIRGGENIYPKEIEEFLYTQEPVKDVQVVGIPSERYGEEVMAYIILKEGCTMTEDEVKEAVRSHMARHKVPSHVAFIDAFPMTASGKIQKFKLRDMAVDKIGLHEAAAIETA